MSKRKKRRKAKAISAFGLKNEADYYETAPLYRGKLQETDLMWLADQYRGQRDADPSVTLEIFAAQYGVLSDELRGYLPELSGEMGYSIVVWHGTSQSRAESILEEGFRGGRIFFTQRLAVARGYAQRRANGERDSPAVIQCAIDLNEYSNYRWGGGCG